MVWQTRKIAYFSMEIAIREDAPTYSGGLGVLAGDTIRAAADMGLPTVAVTLIHRKGYFTQRIDAEGLQHEDPTTWDIDRILEKIEPRVEVTVDGRPVLLRAWLHRVVGCTGHEIPVFLLDADLPENDEEDRALTDHLYGGGPEYRLRQEIVLGIGGVRLLRSLGLNRVERFHMNEGHSAFLTLELIQERRRANGRRPLTPEDIQAIRSQCVFTTHTPVPAGHDVYPTQQIQAALGRETTHDLKDILDFDGELNMTLLALHLSGYVNGVARKHGYVSRAMFPEFDIGWITNGVHPGSWVAPAMQAVFDRHLEGWREDNYNLRYAFGIPTSEIWKAHVKAKTELIQRVNRIAKTRLRPDTLTLGFARRMTAYKRPGLIFRDLDRLRRIAIGGGKFQIVYAGKAHPRDDKGKELIQLVQKSAAVLQSAVPIAFAPNYDLALGRLITSGVDVWLNTPIPPLEASGTSGMKAAVNGVPSLSIMDGWWIEGCIEGVTGWAIGERDRGLLADDDSVRDSASLYDLLEGTIIPLYYTNPEGFRAIMRNAIALNGSFFNTQRMMNEYVTKAYFR